MNKNYVEAFSFFQKVKKQVESLGLFAEAKESGIQASFSKFAYTIMIDNGDFGATYYFSTTAFMALEMGDFLAENIARSLHYKFSHDFEYFTTKTAYDALSNEAKAALNIACLNGYLELQSYEENIANELYESKLCRGGSIGIPYVFSVIPESITMFVCQI